MNCGKGGRLSECQWLNRVGPIFIGCLCLVRERKQLRNLSFFLFPKYMPIYIYILCMWPDQVQFETGKQIHLNQWSLAGQLLYRWKRKRTFEDDSVWGAAWECLYSNGLTLLRASPDPWLIFHLSHGTWNNKWKLSTVPPPSVLYCCFVPDNFPVCFCCSSSQANAIYLCTQLCNYPSNLVTVRIVALFRTIPTQCVPLYWIVMATRSKAVVIAPKPTTPWHRFRPLSAPLATCHYFKCINVYTFPYSICTRFARFHLYLYLLNNTRRTLSSRLVGR